MILYYESMMKKFKSSFSKAMIVSTTVIMAVLMAAMAFSIYRMMNYSAGSQWHVTYLTSAIVILLCIVVAYALQIDHIALTDTELTIKRKIGKTVISRSDIIDVKRKESARRDMRVFGIRGLFGHIGIFNNRYMQQYTLYAKDGNKLVAITTQAKTYVVSCDEPEEFLKEVKK